MVLFIVHDFKGAEGFRHNTVPSKAWSGKYRDWPVGDGRPNKRTQKHRRLRTPMGIAQAVEYPVPKTDKESANVVSGRDDRPGNS